MTLAIYHHTAKGRMDGVPYPSWALSDMKKMLEQKQASSLKVIEGALNNNQRLSLVRQLNDFYGSDEFLSRYSEYLRQEVVNSIGEQYSSMAMLNKEMFSINASRSNLLTTAFSGVKSTSYTNTALTRFDNLIVNLRAKFSALLPHANFSSNNQKFFKELGGAFAASGDESLIELVENCDTLAQQYSSLLGNRYTSKGTKAKLPEGWLSQTNGALMKLIGTGFWELVVAKARYKAMKELEDKIFPDIEKAFLGVGSAAGWKATVSGWKHTGATKDSSVNKEIVADSLINIRLHNEGDNVGVTIAVGDSTKFSQSLATRGAGKAKGGTTVKSTVSQNFTLNYALSQINEGLKNYWEKRLGNFLTSSNHKAYFPQNNWKNTLEAVKILAIYDTLAQRIDGGVQTMSFNTQILTMQSLALLGANGIQTNMVSIHGLAQAVQSKYSSYVDEQYYANGYWKRDIPERHDNTYINFINTLMQEKFNITVRVLSLFNASKK